MANARLPQAFALEREERELVGRVDLPQLLAEFEAVDDGGFRREADVFRAQVAVSLHDATAPDSLLELVRARLQELELIRGNRLLSVLKIHPRRLMS